MDRRKPKRARRPGCDANSRCSTDANRRQHAGASTSRRNLQRRPTRRSIRDRLRSKQEIDRGNGCWRCCTAWHAAGTSARIRWRCRASRGGRTFLRRRRAQPHLAARASYETACELPSCRRTPSRGPGSLDPLRRHRSPARWRRSWRSACRGATSRASLHRAGWRCDRSGARRSFDRNRRRTNRESI